MIVKNERDLQGMLRIGEICGQALQHMLAHAEVGMTTRELDQIGQAFLEKHNARSAPITAYKFPGWTCISLNDEAAHGIPGDKVIQAGDMLNVDVSAVLEGYWGDTGASMIMPPGNKEYERLCDTTREALDAGIREVVAGAPISNIGRAIEQIARKGGYRLIRDLGGHGVGRHIHEKPSILNYYDKRQKQVLVDGLVFTVEPFLSLGKGQIYTASDGWTLKSTDGSIAAQYEHTIIVNGNEPILVTKV